MSGSRSRARCSRRTARWGSRKSASKPARRASGSGTQRHCRHRPVWDTMKASGATQSVIEIRGDHIDAGMRAMTDDADAPPATPDPDDHVARLQAQIDAAKARRAGYRAEAAGTVARGGPTRPTDEDLGIIKTDDTTGRI